MTFAKLVASRVVRFSQAARLALLGLALFGASAAASASERVPLQIRWVETRPVEGIFTPDFMFALHAGQIDFHDYDQPPSQELVEFIQRPPGGLRQLWLEWRERYPEAAFANLLGDPQWQGPQIGTPPPGSPRYQVATVSVDPLQQRFLSYLGRIQPTDDAFVGNEEPFAIELFDAQGRFMGPLYVDVFGSEVLDAGVCANRETGLSLLDALGPAAVACTEGEGRVLPHPGLNGSQRNPEATPQRVLGGAFAHEHLQPIRYDPVAADFSRPGYKLGRLVITRADVSRHAPTGSWYSPERSGEGFNFELLEPAAEGSRPRLAVYWYTYAPDGSGRQVWLSGVAELADEGLGAPFRVQMLRTEGGGFGSVDNPQQVTRTPWGEVDFFFHSCSEGSVAYRPVDAGWPAGGYVIERLSPAIEGLGWLCELGRAQLQRPD